ncbi:MULTISPECIES: hypothetical protein [Streptomyces]|uniref:Uncharacterized protein n=2 Tax=Streptomyces TaxID=1883 RepID=A0ABU4KIC8_9ACTN|nr:hypothetical protein [Streptomyces roseolus]MDX2297545.1 hypothetical protein [Streptomyces roseolus]
MAGEEPNDARPRQDAEAPQDARPDRGPQDAPPPGPDLAKPPSGGTGETIMMRPRRAGDGGTNAAGSGAGGAAGAFGPPAPGDGGTGSAPAGASGSPATGGPTPGRGAAGAFGPPAPGGGGSGQVRAGGFGPPPGAGDGPGATVGDAGGFGAPAGSGTGSAPGVGAPAAAGTDASATGSFRLPAPGPAQGPAPWEAPQNGGSHGATAAAGPGATSGGGFGPPTEGYGGGYGGYGPAPGQAPAAAPGWAGAGTLPPPPTAPPGGGGGEARPLQAALIALLNLSCLGLGYVVLRQWLFAALCWAATAGLLVTALPADADGVPQGVLVGYGVFLLAAAADGARRGLRARITFGATVRRLALPLAVLLLAAPVGGAVAWAGAHEDAREEARQQALLARLADADALVKSGVGTDFATAEPSYRRALTTYQELARDHAGSRAAKLVPASLDAYYEAVSAPYDEKKYCAAILPLKHLRSLPGTVDKALLGDRPAGTDEPLAHSLYECGAGALSGTATAAATDHFNDLTATFPQSPYVGKATTAVRDAIRAKAAAVADTSVDRCATTEELRALRTVATGATGLSLAGARADADRGVRKGVFACGTDQFGDEEFTKAVETMNQYVKDYPDGESVDHARSIAIAAQIAAEEPEAGKKLPPATVPGGARMTMVVSNDADDEVELLYTGPVTGKITLKACGGCRSYERLDTLRPGFKPCSGPSSKYPKVTIQLPAGKYHLLQKRAGTGFSTAGDTKSSKATIEPGYSYTNCLYVTKGLY